MECMCSALTLSVVMHKAADMHCCGIASVFRRDSLPPLCCNGAAMSVDVARCFCHGAAKVSAQVDMKLCAVPLCGQIVMLKRPTWAEMAELEEVGFAL